MKVVANLVGLLPLLACHVDARSRARTRATEDPLEQKHLVTAFVVGDDGPSVECWEVDAFLPGKKGSSSWAKKMGVAEGGLTGVDILSYDGPGTIQPPTGGEAHAQFFPIVFAAVTVGTCVVIGKVAGIAADTTLGDDKFVFDDANGDDWFYFEDPSSSGLSSDKQHCAATEPTEPHFQTDVLSNNGATIIQFKFDERPAHKVLYKGRCKFAGLVDSEEVNTHVRSLRTQDL